MSETETTETETTETGAAAVETLDTSLTAVEEAPAEQVRPLAEPAKPDAGGFIWGTGRRKAAVARVRIKPGDGKFLIKGKEVDTFFSEPQHRAQCLAPLKATGMEGKLDIYVNTTGGGITGQAGAVMLGLARALKGYDPTLEQALRDEGYLSRDSRKVERKKYGQRGARRRFQFSKR
jgi:small subunit ribosomal protein S9